MFEKVNKYYLSRLGDLPYEKQFHFASRLWLWTNDPVYEDLLRELKPEFCGDGSPKAINDILGRMLASQKPEFGSKNAAAERAPYFARYPLLRQVLPLLFRLMFIKTVYGIDARRTLDNHIELEAIDHLAAALSEDEEAIAILSTHACNFYYLWYRFFKDDLTAVPVQRLYDIGQTSYDPKNLTHSQLQFYLYTHCIIGESLFYKRALPQDNLAVYQAMCTHLEQILAQNFRSINLDNKCEFLVASAIAGYKSELKDAVFDEASRSFSAEGDFIIDVYNDNPQFENVTLEKSEHRNVLFIMSGTGFNPTKRVIG